MEPLSFRFYQRDTITVARELLGKQLFHKQKNQITSGIIIETEAYIGVDDPASHSYGGRQTDRVKSMYLEGGHAYVYFIYGMHFCFNVVTQKQGNPQAVLIRALWPVDGINLMQKRRHTENIKNLCSGPAKLCEALGIERSCDGYPLSGPQLLITKNVSFKKIENHIQETPRVGVDYAGDALHWPLRFSIDPDLIKSK